MSTSDNEAANGITCVSSDYLESGIYDAVLFEGDGDALAVLNSTVASRTGPIVSVYGLSTDEIDDGEHYPLTALLRETSLSVNTAAAGGNASLMMVG